MSFRSYSPWGRVKSNIYVHPCRAPKATSSIFKQYFQGNCKIYRYLAKSCEAGIEEAEQIPQHVGSFNSMFTEKKKITGYYRYSYRTVPNMQNNRGIDHSKKTIGDSGTDLERCEE
jgi:hypothetical protein